MLNSHYRHGWTLSESHRVRLEPLEKIKLFAAALWARLHYSSRLTIDCRRTESRYPYLVLVMKGRRRQLTNRITASSMFPSLFFLHGMCVVLKWKWTEWAKGTRLEAYIFPRYAPAHSLSTANVCLKHLRHIINCPQLYCYIVLL